MAKLKENEKIITSEPKEIVFTPQQVASQTIKAVEEMQAEEARAAGVYTGIPSLDNYVLPMRPGDLITVLGRPGNGKTTLILAMLQKEAKKIQEQESDEIVVYVTWETAVEEQGLISLSAETGINRGKILRGFADEADMVQLRKAAIRRSTTPLWIIGHSIINRKERPGLTLSDVEQALTWIENTAKKKIRVVAFDYLQLIEAESGDERRLQVGDATQRVKNLGYRYGCPTILGVQAKREVDYRDFKLPIFSDAYESSVAEHAPDKIFSVWMPKQYGLPDGEPLPLYSHVECSDTLMLIGLCKQRWHVSNKIIRADVDFKTGLLVNDELLERR